MEVTWNQHSRNDSCTYVRIYIVPQFWSRIFLRRIMVTFQGCPFKAKDFRNEHCISRRLRVHNEGNEASCAKTSGIYSRLERISTIVQAARFARALHRRRCWTFRSSFRDELSSFVIVLYALHCPSNNSVLSSPPANWGRNRYPNCTFLPSYPAYVKRTYFYDL
jgi:hypothetical protein